MERLRRINLVLGPIAVAVGCAVLIAFHVQRRSLEHHSSEPVAIRPSELLEDFKPRQAAIDKSSDAVRVSAFDALHKPGLDDARRFLSSWKQRTPDMDEMMKAFSLRRKGGIGIGQPGSIKPDGIEAMFVKLGKAPPTADELKLLGDDLARAAYVTAVVGEHLRSRYPSAQEKQTLRLTRDRWTRWSDELTWASLEYVEAVKENDALKVHLAARKVNGTCQQCHTALNPSVSDVIADLERPGYTRRHAAMVIRESHWCADPKNLPELSKALEHHDPFVRENVAHCIGNMKEQARPAIPKLIESIKDEKPDVRAEAMGALKKIGLKVGTPFPAVDRALLASNYHTKYWYAHHLGSAKEKDLVPLLAGALEQPDVPVRLLAIDLLEQFGDKEAVPALRRALRDQEDEIRKRATLTLVKIDRQAVCSELTRAIRDPDPMIRGRSAIGLAKVGKAAVPDLMAVLKEQDRDVRGSALFALRKIGPDAKDSVPLLLDILKSDDELLRTLAAEALKSIDPEAAAKAGVK